MKTLVSSSGFQRRKTSVEIGLLILSITYGTVFWLNPEIQVASSYCPEQDEGIPCYRPDLIAYKVTSAMCMTYMGLMGLYNWYFTKRLQELSQTSPEDRLFGPCDAGDHQNVAIFCYQVWDFCVSLTIPEHMEPIFLVHHVLAALAGYFSLDTGMVPYYAVYFGGCSEVSSIFLVFADMDELVPPTSGSTYEQCILLCKTLFALSFTYYRVVKWWIVSVQMWSDSLLVLRTGSGEKQRPGKSFFLYVFLALNALLGMMQLFWFAQILEAVRAS